MGTKLDVYKSPASEIAFNIDAYIVKVLPENHANYLAFKADEAAWYSLFTRARLNRAGKQHHKGFIEIYY